MKTELVLVVDRSGSMAAIKKDMEGGLNTLIYDQKLIPGECYVTYVSFDSVVETVFEEKPIHDVPLILIQPRGWTALYDAVGLTIDKVGARLAAKPAAERPEKVIVAIVTDGLENFSKELRDPGAVKTRIDHQREKYNWEFLYLGANQDAFAIGTQLGVQHTVSYAATGAGAAAASASISEAVSVTRGGGRVKDLQGLYDSLVP